MMSLVNVGFGLLVLSFGFGVDDTAKKEPIVRDKMVVVINEAANAKMVDLQIGQELELRLKGERAMTGWGGLVLTPPKELLAVKNRSFEAAAKAKDTAIGTYVFRVNPLKAGTCEIFCRYIYPDGNGYENNPRLTVQVVREFRVTVRIIDKKP